MAEQNNDPWADWTPLGEDAESYHARREGIPQYMKGALRDWFRTEFDSFGHQGPKAIARMRKYDLRSRRQAHADNLSHGPDSVFQLLDEDEILRIMDWVILDNLLSEEYDSSDLEEVLDAGGSVWKVGVRSGFAGLERRVPQGVQDAADSAMATPGDAGRLLSEAWHAVYGINQQPDLGYRKSIEAVEAVVLPAVAPGDDTATLGKAMGQMRAHGDWKLPFVKEHKQNPSQAVILGMMQALWSGHSDRHPGTPNYVLSTQAAAEAAVSIAVTLVNLFSTGAVTRRP
ncbi:hypothetical protein KZC52_03530 [Microbacterium sp. kSW2-24]|uniref:hypothetical protein n=1 Tax=Microbacterium galbinum TaxID=2851646 RepID=UPI001FFD5E1B|nr:hypothetical protein [Microbacterium galbinum]MCK2021980.1 hypothetical protein [Microbacterium galbinum]